MKRAVVFAVLIVLFSCNKEKKDPKENTKPEEEAVTTTDTTALSKRIDYREYGIGNTSSVTVTENGTMADIRPFLPKLNAGEYNFVRYYNISNNDNYGILCVLEMVGVADVNLITYDSNAPRSYTQIDSESFNIWGDRVKNPLGSKDFKNIQKGDQITVICFHDDEFDVTNANNNRVLKFYRDRLPKIDLYPEHYSDPNKEPKRGNGGILTVR